MYRIVFAILVTGQFISCCGCANEPNNAEATPHPWVALPTEAAFTDWNWKKLNSDQVKSVEKTQWNRAIAILDKASFHRLTEAEYQAFTSAKEPIADGLHAYLVRGISIENLTGAHEIKKCRSRLWIRFGALGVAKHIRKNPLIVILAFRPKSVFVDAATAE